jgi:hypothetical protein
MGKGENKALISIEPERKKESIIATYGIGDNVLLENIPGIKFNLFQRNIEIIRSLSNSNCRIMFEVMSRLNQRGELCILQERGEGFRWIPVETEKQFYEAAGIDKGTWRNFKKAIEPWQLIKKCKVRISGKKTLCTRTSIVFDPTFFVSSYNKVTVEQAVMYYDKLAPVLSTSAKRSFVLNTMKDIGKQIFEQLDKGVGIKNITLETPIGQVSLNELAGRKNTSQEEIVVTPNEEKII